MSTPVPITEDAIREYLRMIAGGAVRSLHERFGVTEAASVTVTVRMANGREISAEAARNE